MNIKPIPVEQIDCDPDQPRKFIDPVKLDELADSIIEEGLIQPIVLRWSDKPGRIKFYIIAGQRRWKAHLRAYEKTGDIKFLNVESIIREVAADAAYVATVIENAQREELRPLEEAFSFLRLQQKLGKDGKLATQDMVAKKIGKNRSYVANSLRLLSLDPAVLRLAEQAPDHVTRGHLVPLAGLRPEDQRQLLHRAIEGMRTVRHMEEDARLCRERYEREEKGVSEADVMELLMRNLSTDASNHIGNKVQIVRFKDGQYRFEASFHSAPEMEGFLEKFGLRLDVDARLAAPANKSAS